MTGVCYQRYLLSTPFPSVFYLYIGRLGTRPCFSCLIPSRFTSTSLHSVLYCMHRSIRPCQQREIEKAKWAWTHVYSLSAPFLGRFLALPLGGLISLPQGAHFFLCFPCDITPPVPPFYPLPSLPGCAGLLGRTGSVPSLFLYIF